MKTATYVGMYACGNCQSAGVLDVSSVEPPQEHPKYCPWCGHDISAAIEDALKQNLAKDHE